MTKVQKLLRILEASKLARYFPGEDIWWEDEFSDAGVDLKEFEKIVKKAGPKLKLVCHGESPRELHQEILAWFKRSGAKSFNIDGDFGGVFGLVTKGFLAFGMGDSLQTAELDFYTSKPVPEDILPAY